MKAELEEKHSHESLVLNGVLRTQSHTRSRVRIVTFYNFVSRLFLQSDNTVKEVRNTYGHRILSSLVQGNVFRQCGISHMLPGHTHEDVDAVLLSLR